MTSWVKKPYDSFKGMFEPGPARKGPGSGTYAQSGYAGSGEFKAMESNGMDGRQAHGPMRGSPGMEQQEAPSIWEFIFIPWLCGVVVMLFTLLSAGSYLWMVIIPALLICAICGGLAWQKWKQGGNGQAIFSLLCFISSAAAFIVSLVVYVHFLLPYHELGMGATYLDMLPSQSAAGASDATAIMFAPGTSIDLSRSYGYVDGRNPDGTIYCVAPMGNKWTNVEPTVQFFAAGTNCCGARDSFGCSEAGAGALGALILATESTADEGFKKAVEGASVEHHIQPANGWVLLKNVNNPMELRQDKWSNAVRLVLIYILVYLLLSCVVGAMASNVAKK